MSDVDNAKQLANEILKDIETLELSDTDGRAEDFTSSVRSKVESMLAWMEDTGRTTPKMVAALERMSSGVQRWLERR